MEEYARIKMSSSETIELEVGEEIVGWVLGYDIGPEFKAGSTTERTGRDKPYYLKLLTEDRGVVRMPISRNLTVCCRLVGMPIRVFITRQADTKVAAGSMKNFDIDVQRAEPSGEAKLLLDLSQAKLETDDGIPF